MRRAFFLVPTLILALHAQPYTRGVGVYPGDPKEDFAAAVVPDTSGAYRNLALHRAAYQSSAYDFNLTSQLVTDGIKETRMPRWFAITTSDVELSRQLREHAQDHNVTTNNPIAGPKAWYQIEFRGDAPPEVDRVEVPGLSAVASADGEPGYAVTVSGSDNGTAWTELGRISSSDRLPGGRGGFGFGGRGGGLSPAVDLSRPARMRFIRVAFEAPAASRWTISELVLKDKGARVEAGGPYQFNSSWKPATNGGEWVYVDLGAPSTFDKVVLTWLRRPSDGALQASDDAKTWRTLTVLPITGEVDELKLERPEKARYVRALLTKSATDDGYVLTEFEVWGRGGVVVRPKAAPIATAGGRLTLAAGSWRLQRD